jgi:hypothetical protein
VNAPEMLTLADPQVTADLRTYVTRARAADDGAVHLQAMGSVLAAYVCLMRPRLLGEATPTILGLRTMPLGRPAQTELTVSLSSMADRLARMEENDVVLPLPPMQVKESWTGVLPPRSGWEPVEQLAAGDLRSAAEAGIREVAAAVPQNPGQLMVNNARSKVWGRTLPGATVALPAGAAFAALTLGFLDDEPASLFRSGRWLRLSTARGHVLIRIGAAL